MKHLLTYESLFSRIIHKDEKVGEKILKNFDNSVYDIEKKEVKPHYFKTPDFIFNFDGKKYKIKNVSYTIGKISGKLEFQHNSGVFLPLDISESLATKIYNKFLQHN